MKRLASLVFFAALAAPTPAADWTQFRGPQASGVADDPALPVVWNETANIHWKVRLPGRGLSNPVVAGGRIYVTAASGWQQKRLHVLCFDEATGRQLWERQFWATGTTQCHPKTNMAAPTPVTDGERVFALFATQDLVALDRDGNLLWFRSLMGDYPTIGNNVGMAASPVLYKDVLLVPVENVGDSFVAGIDANTGRNKWRQPRKRDINWVTPLVIEHGGRAQAIFQSGDRLTAYDAQTGKLLWEMKDKGFFTIPSPVFADGMIFTFGKQFLAIRPGDGGKEPEVAWESRKLKPGYSSPLYYRGKLYVLSARGVLTCADAKTGAELWDLRLDGNFAASPVAGNGMIYAVSEEGVTTVIEAGEKGRLVGTNPIGDKVLATPVLANGAIYLRSDDYLYCIRKKAKS